VFCLPVCILTYIHASEDTTALFLYHVNHSREDRSEITGITNEKFARDVRKKKTRSTVITCDSVVNVKILKRK